MSNRPLLYFAAVLSGKPGSKIVDQSATSRMPPTIRGIQTIDHDCPGCCGELVVEQVLEIGCRQVVETPAGVDYRHTGPEMIESKREGSGRARSPLGIRAHGHRIPWYW